MAYVTEAQLVDLFGADEMIQLSNLDEPNATAVNSARITSATAWASEIIDSYASVFYVTPIAPVPYILTGYAKDLVRYQLDCNSPRDDVRQRYEDALKWLEMLAKGIASLGPNVPRKVLAPTVIPATVTGPTAFSTPTHRFTEVSLNGL
jgi:phage gp36-like protein